MRAPEMSWSALLSVRESAVKEGEQLRLLGQREGYAGVCCSYEAVVCVRRSSCRVIRRNLADGIRDNGIPVKGSLKGRHWWED